jgi:hypothetical protein
MAGLGGSVVGATGVAVVSKPNLPLLGTKRLVTPDRVMVGPPELMLAMVPLPLA